MGQIMTPKCQFYQCSQAGYSHLHYCKCQLKPCRKIYPFTVIYIILCAPQFTKTKFFPNLLLCCSICFFKSFTSLSFLFNDFLKHLLIFGFYSNNKVIQSFSWKIPPDSYYFEKKLLNRKVGNWKRFVYISDWWNVSSARSRPTRNAWLGN